MCRSASELDVLRPVLVIGLNRHTPVGEMIMAGFLLGSMHSAS